MDNGLEDVADLFDYSHLLLTALHKLDSCLVHLYLLSVDQENFHIPETTVSQRLTILLNII